MSRSTMALAAAVGVGGLLVTLIALRTVTRPQQRRAAPVATPKVESPEVAFAREIERVDVALRSENWLAAIDACVRLEPQDSAGKCRARRARAEAEQSAKMTFLAFRDAAERGDTDLAVAKYLSIPNDSVYHGQSQVLWPVVRDAYARLYLPQATKALSAGRCDEARALADRVASVDEANPGLAPIRKRCPAPGAAPAPSAPVAAAPRPRPASEPPPEKPPREQTPESKPPAEAAATPPTEQPPTETPAETPPAEGPSAEEQAAALIDEADRLWANGENKKAIQVAQKALKLQPGDPKAVRIVGAASCDLKDKAKAAWAYERLNAAYQQFLVSVCQRSGITLP